MPHRKSRDAASCKKVRLLKDSMEKDRMTETNMLHILSELSSSRTILDNTRVSECPEMFAKLYCLNGATCFSIQINNSSLYNCWCPKGFHGLRCEYKYVENGVQISENQLVRSSNQFAVASTLILGKNETLQMQTQNGGQPHDRHHRQPLLLLLISLLIVFLVIILLILILRFLNRKNQATSRTPSSSNSLQVSSIRDQQMNNQVRKNGEINCDIVTIDLNELTENKRTLRLHYLKNQVIPSGSQQHHHCHHQEHSVI